MHPWVSDWSKHWDLQLRRFDQVPSLSGDSGKGTGGIATARSRAVPGIDAASAALLRSVGTLACLQLWGESYLTTKGYDHRTPIHTSSEVLDHIRSAVVGG